MSLRVQYFSAGAAYLQNCGKTTLGIENLCVVRECCLRMAL